MVLTYLFNEEPLLLKLMYENNETQSKHNLIKTKWINAALIMQMSPNNSYIMNSILHSTLILHPMYWYNKMYVS